MADEPNSDDVKYDASKRAEAVLEHILNVDKRDVNPVEAEPRVPISEVLRSKPVLDIHIERVRSRVLFVTTEQNVLMANSIERQYYANLSSFFEEVHVFCLIPRRGNEAVERVGQNLWIYQIRSAYWWYLPWKSIDVVHQSLMWNGSFWPDLVVGIDPFEASLAALFIANKFERPLQVHVKTDPYSKEYKKLATDNNWRQRVASYVLRRTDSIWTTSRIIQGSIAKKFKKANIQVLPHFYNFTGLLGASPAYNLHERYPDFSFIMLAFGSLSADSHMHDLFSATHTLLRNPRIGMIVIGDGPGRQLFMDKVKLLGIERNVVFLKEVDDLSSFLKTADVLIEMDNSEESEVRVLQAAAAGLPMVVRQTELRQDLFKDGESVLFCPDEDLLCINKYVLKLINNIVLRKRLSAAAQMVAESRLHEGPETYYQNMSQIIESVLVNPSGNPV